MSRGGTTVALLTPPGTGAIAVVEVRGPQAWEWAKRLFAPAGRPLPDAPEPGRFWCGTLGCDEVILAAVGEDTIEVHCHGGRRVVRWIIDQFLASGAEEQACHANDPILTLLPRALTLRTAAILLDQFHGAWDTAIRQILTWLNSDPIAALAPLKKLAGFAPVGRHLVEPWKVVVAGPPNVGKSSLVNALAGYQRAVVSATAGTTRDTVSVRITLDGWPVELIDTAGLRDAEGLEAAGIARARHALAEADLVLWVMDASSRDVVYPDDETRAVARPKQSTGWVFVMNKTDVALDRPPDTPVEAVRVSARTGDNMVHLAKWIVYRLVPVVPLPGDAVPFTPVLADQVEAALVALVAGNFPEAIRLLL